MLAVAQFVLIAVWSRRRTPRARRAVWGGFVVFPLLVLLQALVVTDRERLMGICHDLADAVRRADVDAFGEHISPRFQSDPGPGDVAWDKAALLERFESASSTYRIEEPRLRTFEIQVDGARAAVCFAATCRIVTAEQIIARRPSNWELIFERQASGWRVTNIRPRPSRLFPYRRLHDLPR